MKKKREEVEVKNQAEGMLFETEKQMNESSVTSYS